MTKFKWITINLEIEESKDVFPAKAGNQYLSLEAGSDPA